MVSMLPTGSSRPGSSPSWGTLGVPQLTKPLIQYDIVGGSGLYVRVKRKLFQSTDFNSFWKDIFKKFKNKLLQVQWAC